MGIISSERDEIKAFDAADAYENCRQDHRTAKPRRGDMFIETEYN